MLATEMATKIAVLENRMDHVEKEQDRMSGLIFKIAMFCAGASGGGAFLANWIGG